MDRPEHFPHAPVDWSPEIALRKALEEDIELEEDHWAVTLALQEYFSHHDDSKQVNRRLLHDALNEKFHHKGASLICTGCVLGAPLRKAVDWPVWRHQLVVWTDPMEVPYNRLHLQPGDTGCCSGGRRPGMVSNQSIGRSDC